MPVRYGIDLVATQQSLGRAIYDRRMRTLVIGGTLFIGREIVRRLATRGYDVTVLHRRDDHDLGPGIGNVKADRADLTAVSRVMRDGRFDAVFDVAYDWEKGTTPDQVEAAARACGHELQRYVFISSIAAYVPGVNLRESAPLVPDDFSNPYAQRLRVVPATAAAPGGLPL
jgi:2'-hydroxyisoflavone reductase